jgi:hypothetical protein
MIFMEAIFSFKLSELNNEVLQKIKALTDDDNAVVTIGVTNEKGELYLNETKEEFIRRIQSRIDEYHISNKYSAEDSLSVVNEPEP